MIQTKRLNDQQHKDKEVTLCLLAIKSRNQSQYSYFSQVVYKKNSYNLHVTVKNNHISNRLYSKNNHMTHI